jgi:hypothetical protein
MKTPVRIDVAPTVRIEHDDPDAICTRLGWAGYQERLRRRLAGEAIEVMQPVDYFDKRTAPGS